MTNLNRLVRPQLLGQDLDEVFRFGLESNPGLPDERRIGVDRAEVRSLPNQIDRLLELALGDQDLKNDGTLYFIFFPDLTPCLPKDRVARTPSMMAGSIY